MASPAGRRCCGRACRALALALALLALEPCWSPTAAQHREDGQPGRAPPPETLRRCATLVHQAVDAGSSGDMRTAREKLEESVKLCPGDATALGNLGFIYAVSGDAERAKAMLQRSIALQSSVPEPWVNVGNVLKVSPSSSHAPHPTPSGAAHSTRRRRPRPPRPRPRTPAERAGREPPPRGGEEHERGSQVLPDGSAAEG